jgi:leader peptidase (prepilin peptidase) / N-methyltransferase
MIQIFSKTRARSYLFLRYALAWRAPERQYALVAWCLIGGALWLLANLAIDLRHPFNLFEGLYLLAILTAVCAIDARYGIIPNSLVIGLAVGGLFQICLSGRSDLLDRVFDAALVFAMGYVFRMTYRWARGHDGLGLGDVKLSAAGVLWIDIADLPTLLLIAVFSAFLSLLVLKAEGCNLSGKLAISFGPHLAIGLWLIWVLAPTQFNT